MPVDTGGVVGHLHSDAARVQIGLAAKGLFDLLFNLYRADGRPDLDVVGYPDHTPDVAHLAFHFIALVRVFDDVWCSRSPIGLCELV